MSIGIFFNCTKFWSEEFWLPPKESWANVSGPQTSDFTYGIFAAIILCFMRSSYVFTPIGLRNGLRSTKNHKVPNIPLLEEYYHLNKRPPFNDIRVNFRFSLTLRFKALSKKLDVSDAKVSYWFRAKRNSVKFPEPFLYDTSEFFRAYPHHKMSRCIFWYYMVELAYYVSGLIWVFLEVKRKDFIVMLTHHVVTVALIAFSYLTNYFRIGSVIMLLHDSADFWLEVGLHSCKHQNLCLHVMCLHVLAFHFLHGILFVQSIAVQLCQEWSILCHCYFPLSFTFHRLQRCLNILENFGLVWRASQHSYVSGLRHVCTTTHFGEFCA
ncbi:unnamed protein product [Hydatigera taeniaeformis]|uniref:TLC domain-containing protein n=1 Tax=Hydatigena taeniaeformis TaxID=6205 RepID=A0A0R3WR86_HYDTA|nr:unnamed protein product [Hydatigera taeniaeformis]